MTCTLTLDMARANFADVLLAWVQEPTRRHYYQLDAAATMYQRKRDER